MASITLSSSSNTSPPKHWSSAESISDHNNHRDVSFSSYLTSSEETFIHNLVESNHNLNFPVISSLQEHRRQQHQKQIEDGEIDVFTADRYFNGRMDNQEGTKNAYPRKYQQHNANDENKVVRGHLKLKVQPKSTPSVHSASSSNSQSALLRRNSSRNKAASTTSMATTKDQAKSFFANLGCNCSCYNKKSIDTDEHTGDLQQYGGISSKTRGITTRGYDKAVPNSMKTSLEPADFVRMNKLRIENWAEEERPHANQKNSQLSILSSKDNNHFGLPASTSTLRNPVIGDEEVLDESRKKPLEVFGFPNSEEDKNFIPIEKRLNMLSWDAIPTREDEMDIQGPTTTSETYKDNESDASSDLFEIECLSCSANPVLVRQQSLDAGCLTPSTTCYAPSEASIDWSVITASAADFSSVILSDTEDARSTLATTNRGKMLAKTTTGGRTDAKALMSNDHKLPKRRPGGILSGCKSQKAVRVAGDHIYRTSPPAAASAVNKKGNQRLQRSESFSSLTRFHAESKLNSYSIRGRQQDPHAAGMRTPSWTHSGHSSDLLYFQ